MRKILHSFKILSFVVTLLVVCAGAFAWKSSQENHRKSRKLKKHFHGLLDNLLPDAVLDFLD